LPPRKERKPKSNLVFKNRLKLAQLELFWLKNQVKMVKNIEMAHVKTLQKRQINVQIE